MTEKAIQNLYNKLLKWEGKNASQPYPIHKKLSTEEFGFNDIYEWIAKTYALNTETKILDAGCGIGYGTQYLSKQFNCKVRGISISDEEVRKATLFAKKANIDNYVSFKLQSYDDLEQHSYDFIIAIESVKHTLDINKTILSLKKALKPNGTIVIVDDFLITNNCRSLLIKYAKDWKLKVILKQDHFEPSFVLKKDLTPCVNTKSSLNLHISSILLSIIKPVSKVAPIMRGGIYLEKLFKNNVMKYYVLEFKNIS